MAYRRGGRVRHCERQPGECEIEGRQRESKKRNGWNRVRAEEGKGGKREMRHCRHVDGTEREEGKEDRLRDRRRRGRLSLICHCQPQMGGGEEGVTGREEQE